MSVGDYEFKMCENKKRKPFHSQPKRAERDLHCLARWKVQSWKACAQWNRKFTSLSPSSKHSSFRCVDTSSPYRRVTHRVCGEKSVKWSGDFPWKFSSPAGCVSSHHPSAFGSEGEKDVTHSVRRRMWTIGRALENQTTWIRSVVHWPHFKLICRATNSSLNYAICFFLKSFTLHLIMLCRNECCHVVVVFCAAVSKAPFRLSLFEKSRLSFVAVSSPLVFVLCSLWCHSLKVLS